MDNVLLCLIFLLLFVVFGKWIKNRRNYSVINRIPGPTALPLFGNLWFFIKNQSDYLKIIPSLEQYGGIAQIRIQGESKVLLFDKEYIKIFYSSSLLLDRSYEYHHLTLLLGEANQLSGNGEPWKQARKVTSQTFQRVSHETLQTALNIAIKKLMGQLEQEASDEFLKCQDLLEDTIMTIIRSVTFGEDRDEIEEAFVKIEHVNTYMRIAALRVASPLHMFALTFPFTKEAQVSERIIKELSEMAKYYIRSIRGKLTALKEKCESIPDAYIYSLVSKYSNESDDFLASQFKTLVGASTGTTTGTLGFVLQMIAIHPHVQRKVYEEVRAFQEEGGDELLIADLYKYEYLNAVIKETMRLYPTVPANGRRAENDIQIGEYIVPKGTAVYICPWVTGRSEKYFEDPLKFNPDRFLSANSDETFQYVFEPFHAGARSCPGKKFGLITLKMVLISLVRRFQIFSKFNSIRELDEKVDGLIILKQNGGIFLRFVERQKI